MVLAWEELERIRLVDPFPSVEITYRFERVRQRETVRPNRSNLVDPFASLVRDFAAAVRARAWRAGRRLRLGRCCRRAVRARGSDAERSDRPGGRGVSGYAAAPSPTWHIAGPREWANAGDWLCGEATG